MQQKIFTYEELKNKAKREIERLKISETKMNDIDSLDHALNAAFTIYHLLEWEEKSKNPNSEKRDSLRKDKNSKDLDILHSVVTMNKHAQLSSNNIKQPPTTKQIGGGFITTECGIPLATENGKIITAEGSAHALFGDHIAVDVLKDALSLFS